MRRCRDRGSRSEPQKTACARLASLCRTATSVSPSTVAFSSGANDLSKSANLCPSSSSAVSDWRFESIFSENRRRALVAAGS